ncbi:aLK and LTK ligand 2a [Nerophis lumbriciformis]|uniref:aLK and LTK ligand 2a n=1 Tax=Nerophis lumbriciformis TaxID=546530 RepID=UPI002AE03AF0|nr:ALK and LTK ligand 2-like [Nerophis lumbriciformis]XP_061843279.1 ALK and LTK ligand 2-like [Nerophis lumbriciformis]
MKGLHMHATVGLVLLWFTLVTATPTRTQTSAPGRNASRASRRASEPARREAPWRSRGRTSLVVQRDFHRLKTDKGDQVVALLPQDLRKKEKYLKHRTGPLYFSPKCREHVHKLYHQRDCTIPAYFKRCARLLTRLAGSPQCTGG